MYDVHTHARIEFNSATSPLAGSPSNHCCNHPNRGQRMECGCCQKHTRPQNLNGHSGIGTTGAFCGGGGGGGGLVVVIVAVVV
jgi:hypothetical protein